MELKELVGAHLLTGVDRETKRIKESWGYGYEDCDCISFVLDGVVYSAVEDPDDGYRSSCRELMKSMGTTKNTFPPCAVTGRMQPDSTYKTNDVLELIDVKTGQTVLRVGTANTDDYYPYFVAEWHPEGMAINSNAKNEGLDAPERNS
jgi:hypothetical protein